jgi:hypothetical protein
LNQASSRSLPPPPTWKTIGRPAVGAARGDHQRLGAECDRFLCGLGGALEIDQRHVARRQQAPVDRAELDHVPRMRPRHGVGEVGIRPAFEHRRVVEQRRREHELAGEAQKIDRARAVLARGGAERRPVLGEHDLAVIEGFAAARILEMAVKALVPWEQHVVADAAAILRLEMIVQEARQLHDVRIGIVNDAPAGVGHCPSGLFLLEASLA